MDNGKLAIVWDPDDDQMDCLLLACKQHWFYTAYVPLTACGLNDLEGWPIEVQVEVFNSPDHCKSLSFGLTVATFAIIEWTASAAYALMFVPPSVVTWVRIALSPTGLASTINSVLSEELKYILHDFWSRHASFEAVKCMLLFLVSTPTKHVDV